MYTGRRYLRLGLRTQGAFRTAVRAAGVFAAVCLLASAPITLTTQAGPVSANAAFAANGNSGGNGGSNGGGNGGGSNGGNGGNGNANGKNKGGFDRSATDEGDRWLLLETRKAGVSFAQFTTGISKRYPTDEISLLTDPVQPVSFFSELQAMSGQEITHRWVYDGEARFEANFAVRAELWRVWSTQVLPEDMPGEWIVEIVAENGNVMERYRLRYAPGGKSLAVN